jgi:hypothetical protein
MSSEEEYHPNYDFKIDVENGVKGEEAAKAFVYGSKHEVKVDFRAVDTENFYVEIEQYSDLFQTDRRPSGISTTEAEFWHLVGPGLVGGIWIGTEALRELIKENSFREAHQSISNDSTNASVGVLVPVKAVLQKMGFSK